MPEVVTYACNNESRCNLIMDIMMIILPNTSNSLFGGFSNMQTQRGSAVRPLSDLFLRRKIESDVILQYNLLLLCWFKRTLWWWGSPLDE